MDTIQSTGFCAAIYARLSREDGDREESDSIVNQKNLIRSFLADKPDIRICAEYVDDGYSGASFARPAFQEMMADVKAGKINCIVVKDLSRFGRNYLDAGEYIERIFPFLGIRFIAVNDNYDSLNSNVESDSIIIPFKNLINEAYCRDISVKIRSQLEIKRKKGDFIGSFAAYGYLKDPGNKNHLIVDSFAADVVRDIFRWKINGVSAGDIADRLNMDGILSPMDYKRSQGLRFATPFRVNARSCWNTATVLRVLKNPIYTGSLIQGKSTTPSYKVRRRIIKPREEWITVEGAHEAVIDPCDFEIVQKLLALDTRTGSGGKAVELFSGMVFCGECGGPMVRKTVPSGGKKYIYYICGTHKNEKTCSSHSVRDDVLREIVLESIRKLLQDILDGSRIPYPARTADVRKLKERLDKKQQEIDRYQRLLYSLYESLAEGVIDREEYRSLKKNYTTLCAQAQEQAREIRGEMEGMPEKGITDGEWTERLKGYQNIAELDRAIVASLIERIFVRRDKQVEIVYSWRDEFRLLQGPSGQSGEPSAGKEAVQKWQERNGR